MLYTIQLNHIRDKADNGKSSMPRHRISLASYSITISDASHSTNPTLDNFGGKDLLKIIFDIFKKWETKKATKITAFGDGVRCKIVEVSDRYVKGVLEKGTSGTEQFIADLESGENAHHMTKTQAVMNPHYFLFYLPEGKTKGIFLYQRLGNTSLNVVSDFLLAYFRDHLEPYKLEIRDLFSRAILDQILNSAPIKEIRLIQHEWAADRTDNIFGPMDRPVRIAVSYKSRYNIPISDKLKRVLMGHGKPSDIVERDITPDEVTIVARINKRNQTFTFSDSESQFRPYRDISDIVKFDEANHPSFDSIDAIALSYINDLAKGLYDIPDN